MIVRCPIFPTSRQAIGKTLILGVLLMLGACKPPAADKYIERIGIDGQRTAPAAPVDAPDTEGAIWADRSGPDSMLYGKPGQPAIFVMGCEDVDGLKKVRITRFIAADPKAKALMVLIGNGHIARLPVNAIWNGKVWLWEGLYDPDNPSKAGPIILGTMQPW